MSFPDFLNILQWWLTIFVMGIIFVPLTSIIFRNFLDKGYIFAKIISIATTSYLVLLFGFLKILSFETQNILLITGLLLIINFFIFKKNNFQNLKPPLRFFIFEEGIFFGILLLWSFIHAHQPDIHGLEKYMDYGFINSILRTKYFPPPDMWFAPYSINYYYFGHLATAVLTKLSLLPSSITFNLMLSTVPALGFTATFSIAFNLLHLLNKKIGFKVLTIGGLLSAFLLNFAGNLHTIYLLFKPYQNDNPVPFWELIFSPNTFPNSYWYPNATRFIHNTIHEFPAYSNVVSDLHGHFLDIPFVLLTVAVLLALWIKPQLEIKNCKLEILLISFLLAIMYMTNAWDGIIYLLLAVTILFVKQLKLETIELTNNLKSHFLKEIRSPLLFQNLMYPFLIIVIGFFIFSLPFNLHFKPFTSGVGVLCAPKFLTDVGKFGPFLFESKHCQHSPFWQLTILYGFFYFWAISFLVFLFLRSKQKKFRIISSDIFVMILIIISTLLLIVPEFLYVKDIYPEHYRANTMFKLAYQAFIMLSLSSGYIIIRLLSEHGFHFFNHKRWNLFYWIIGLILFILVSLYPHFAINSYFGELKIYSGLNGTTYLKTLYPDDYDAILWINNNIKDQPIILEAQGDSYTDFGRVSVNTGLPTVLGWTVHEWLWRGTYDIPAPRIQDITKLYESSDLKESKNLLKKYNVSLVFIGDLERQKYLSMNEKKFLSLGKVIYQKGNTKIIKIN